MNKKILAGIFVFILLAVSSVSAEQRWQKVMTTDQYRYYFDTLTIAYGKTAAKSERDSVEPDKNIIAFNAQEVYWNPQDTARELQQADGNTDWSTISYSVGEYKYDRKNNKMFEGDISFFDANSMFIGKISRSVWHDVLPGSNEEKICGYLVKYAKDHNQELKRRS